MPVPRASNVDFRNEGAEKRRQSQGSKSRHVAEQENLKGKYQIIRAERDRLIPIRI